MDSFTITGEWPRGFGTDPCPPEVPSFPDDADHTVIIPDNFGNNIGQPWEESEKKTKTKRNKAKTKAKAKTTSVESEIPPEVLRAAQFGFRPRRQKTMKNQ